MDSVKVTVKSAEKASRLELLIRFIWGFIVAIILGVIGIFVAIAWIVQWLHILLLGKRQGALNKFITAYEVAKTQLNFYMVLATDERPPLVPEF